MHPKNAVKSNWFHTIIPPTAAFLSVFFLSNCVLLSNRKYVWSPVPLQQQQQQMRVEKILASQQLHLPHSIFSLWTPVKRQTLSFPYTPYHDSFFNLCPLIQHQKLFHDQKFSLFFLSEMKDELPPLRQSLFSNVPPFFNYIPNGRNGRFGSSFVRPHTRVQNCHHRFYMY